MSAEETDTERGFPVVMSRPLTMVLWLSFSMRLPTVFLSFSLVREPIFKLNVSATWSMIWTSMLLPPTFMVSPAMMPSRENAAQEVLPAPISMANTGLDSESGTSCPRTARYGVSAKETRESPADLATRQYFSREAMLHAQGTQKSASTEKVRRTTFRRKYSSRADAQRSSTISPSYTGKQTSVTSEVLPEQALCLASEGADLARILLQGNTGGLGKYDPAPDLVNFRDRSPEINGKFQHDNFLCFSCEKPPP